MRVKLVPFLLAVLLASACSPTWDWREFRPENTGLRLLLPCKPDLARRQVVMGRHTLSMTMLSCKAGDASFALAWTELPQETDVAPALAQWTSATLGHIAGVAAPASAFLFKGSTVQPESVRISKSGRSAAGGDVSFNGAWFAVRRSIFQASVHGAPQSPEVLETYFSGIGLP